VRRYLSHGGRSHKGRVTPRPDDRPAFRWYHVRMTEHDRTLLSLIRQVRAQRRSQPDALEGERLRLEGSLIEFVEKAGSASFG
jgi:hypothetical protein